MYSILVLGLIPGTNIQISFKAWLIIVAGLLVLAPVLIVSLKRLIAFGKANTSYPQPLHANLLHHRLQHTAR